MFLELPSKVFFAERSVREAFEQLKNSTTENGELHVALCRAFENLEQNAFCGIHVPKRLIPKEYAQKYGVTNLWKFNLPNGRRLAYSVKGGDGVVLCIILEWFSHKDYERRFGYKAK